MNQSIKLTAPIRRTSFPTPEMGYLTAKNYESQLRANEKQDNYVLIYELIRSCDDALFNGFLPPAAQAGDVSFEFIKSYRFEESAEDHELAP
jgi:hypothetical protein